MARFVGFAAENRGDNGVIVGRHPLKPWLDLLDKGNNGHDADVTRCLLMTQSGH
jgi:hypothetical protein